MLAKLSIQNIALIEKAEIEFGEGLNVLSGETGAGKSILLDSINFVLGAKADKSMIRSGEDGCAVSAVFALEKDSPAFSVLEEIGIEGDEQLILTRRFRADGKGDIRVNGCSVNAAMLRKITAVLVDVHGQSEHFYLLSEANQLKLLDRVAGDAVAAQKQELSRKLAERKSICEALRSLGGDERERGRRIDILQYQMKEIDEAALSEGEEERLKEKKLFFANSERIARALSGAVSYLGGDGAAVDLLRSARRALSDAAPFKKEYAAVEERLESAALEAEDIFETLSEMQDGVLYDAREADAVEDRLDQIRSLKKKYGDTVSKILAYREEIGKECELLQHGDEEFARLKKLQEENDEAVYALCCRLTHLRSEAAIRFCADVEEELRSLNIAHAKFFCEFLQYSRDDIAKATTDGLDSVRFMFSANAGEPLKPLNKVISGGEMSRLMLAIKTQAEAGEVATYLFDEIDAGISGKTAWTVAEKFAAIASRKQIIAVSHLAQIAAMADHNFLICKREAAGKTFTDILPLDEAAKKAELVRLLGGSGGVAAQSLAEELIAHAKKIKNDPEI